MDIIPSDLATYGGEARKLPEDLQSRNERMFLVTVLMMNTALTKQKLDNLIFRTAGIAQKYNCSLRRLDYQQESGLMSCVPLGKNYIPINRALTTTATAIPYRNPKRPFRSISDKSAKPIKEISLSFSSSCILSLFSSYTIPFGKLVSIFSLALYFIRSDYILNCINSRGKIPPRNIAYNILFSCGCNRNTMLTFAFSAAFTSSYTITVFDRK